MGIKENKKAAMMREVMLATERSYFQRLRVIGVVFFRRFLTNQARSYNELPSPLVGIRVRAAIGSPLLFGIKFRILSPISALVGVVAGAANSILATVSRSATRRAELNPIGIDSLIPTRTFHDSHCVLPVPIMSR